MLQRKLMSAGLTGGTSIRDIVPNRVRDRKSRAELNPLCENARSVVRMITLQGGYSGDCRQVPVSLPRVTFIDGPFA